VVLVVLVVILFLQTWRASLIPLLAVPVSIVGTFAVLYLLGFSINTLTLFGLVLAIGIVVDDAIVVVENVERTSPTAASRWRPRTRRCARSAARSSPSRWCCARCSCRWPSSTGVTGEFYRQFAVTIAIATVISGDQFADAVAGAGGDLLRRTTRPRTRRRG
jgi:multidrug efflux pump